MRKNQGKGEEVEDDAEKNRGGFGLNAAYKQHRSLLSENFSSIAPIEITFFGNFPSNFQCRLSLSKVPPLRVSSES